MRGNINMNQQKISNLGNLTDCIDRDRFEEA